MTTTCSTCPAPHDQQHTSQAPTPTANAHAHRLGASPAAHCAAGLILLAPACLHLHSRFLASATAPIHKIAASHSLITMVAFSGKGRPLRRTPLSRMAVSAGGVWLGARAPGLSRGTGGKAPMQQRGCAGTAGRRDMLPAQCPPGAWRPSYAARHWHTTRRWALWLSVHCPSSTHFPSARTVCLGLNGPGIVAL